MKLYIDGNNVAYWGGKKKFNIRTTLALTEYFDQTKQDYLCFFDANVVYRVKNKEDKELLKQALKDTSHYRLAPAGGPADSFILMSADIENAAVISNDLYRDYRDQYPWLKGGPDNKGRLVQGEIYPGGNDRVLMIPEMKISIEIGVNTFITENGSANTVKTGSQVPTKTVKQNQSNSSTNKNTVMDQSTNDNNNLQEQTGLVIGHVSETQTYHQLGILVLDGSGSMTDQSNQLNISKAEAVNMAVRDLVGRIKGGRATRNFSFAVLNFDTTVSTRLDITPATDFDDNDDYDPLNGHGGGTRISEGLNKAHQMAKDFLAQAPEGGVPHSVVVLLLSDGMSADPVGAESVANKIKQNPSIKIAAAYMGTLGINTSDDTSAQTLLRNVSSDPVMFYKTVYGAEDLRAFFEASMSKASGVKHG